MGNNISFTHSWPTELEVLEIRESLHHSDISDTANIQSFSLPLHPLHAANEGLILSLGKERKFQERLKDLDVINLEGDILKMSSIQI